MVDHQASEKPLLTAAITAFNAEDSIERAVASALAQTWRPLEILIVDDGSSDATPAILQRLEAEHREIRVIVHEHNRGTPAARNTLIKHATGEALAFFDDDDTSRPDRIERQWERLRSHERVDGADRPVLCHVSRRTTDGPRRVEYRRALGSDVTRPALRGPQLVAHLLWGGRLHRDDRGVTGTCAQFGRVRVYRDLDGFDERFRRAEDWELDVRLARAGGALIGVADPLLDQHLTHTQDKSLERSLPMQLLLLSVHRDAFPSDAIYAATRRWWQAWYLLRDGRTTEGLRNLWAAMILAPRVTTGRLMRELGPRLLSHLRHRPVARSLTRTDEQI